MELIKIKRLKNGSVQLNLHPAILEYIKKDMWEDKYWEKLKNGDPPSFRKIFKRNEILITEKLLNRLAVKWNNHVWIGDDYNISFLINRLSLFIDRHEEKNKNA